MRSADKATYSAGAKRVSFHRISAVLRCEVHPTSRDWVDDSV